MIKLENKSNNSIVEFRKKRKTKKRTRIIIVAVILVALAVLAYVLRDTIFEPFRDIKGKLMTEETAEGFPVKLTGSASYSLSSVGENFVLLTDTYLYSYNENGGMIANIQHGYQNPVDKTNSKRILLYDKGAHEFSLLNRSGVLYEKALDDNIIYGEIGSTEYTAIVTNSTRYANYLYIFNGDGTQVFRWASVDNKIMQVAFSNDEKRIYVTALGASGGELITYLYCFDLQNAEGEVWKTAVGSGLPFRLTEFAGGVLVVSDHNTVLLNSTNGEITNTFNYSKTINQISVSENYISLLFSDSLSTDMALVTIGSTLEQIETTALPSTTVSVYSGSDGVYALVGSEILTLDSTTLAEAKKTSLEDEYSQMILINNNAYLLGYDVVQRMQIS